MDGVPDLIVDSERKALMPKRSRRRWVATVAAAGAVTLTSASLGVTLGTAPVADAAGPAPGRSVWGKPLVEQFDTFEDSRWYKYVKYPNVRPRRDPALVGVAGGNLVLAGSVDAAQGEVGAAVGHRVRQKYGRWEVRFQIDRGAGYQGAVLLWPNEGCRWPDDGEIDLVEVGSPNRDKGINAIHNGKGDTGKKINSLRGDYSTWHTVAVDWTPKELRYFMDGKLTWRITDPRSIPTTCTMRLALQLDECAPPVYRGYVECRNARTPPVVRMRVDWVKVFPYVGEPVVSPAAAKRVRAAVPATRR